MASADMPLASRASSSTPVTTLVSSHPTGLAEVHDRIDEMRSQHKSTKRALKDIIYGLKANADNIYDVQAGLQTNTDNIHDMKSDIRALTCASTKLISFVHGACGHLDGHPDFDFADDDVSL
jgi:hypothetical protein